MNLLYIGNKLSRHGSSLTGIEILGPLLEDQGYAVRYASDKKSKILRLAHMLIQTIKSRRWAQLVLIDTYSTSNFWYAVVIGGLCRTLKIPYIPILHGGNLGNRLKKSPLASRKLFGKARVNVAPSGFLHKVFTDAGFKVKLIRNPVNLENFEFTKRDTAHPKLLWVRGLSEMSNPAMAIRVARLVKQELGDVRLCIVGPDAKNMRQSLEKQAIKLGLDVEFKGKLTPFEWASLAKDFDIFLNTSRVDNAPFSMIEAMSLGLFVVSTNIGGIPYLADDRCDALLVAPDDDRAMADAVLKIIGDQGLRQTMQKCGFDKSRRFSWAHIQLEWDKILQA